MNNDDKNIGLTLSEAMNLQDIEANPLDAEQSEMFAMFEREGWSQERRLPHILARNAEQEPRAAE